MLIESINGSDYALVTNRGRTAGLAYLLRCETGGGLANVLAGLSGMAAELGVRLSRI
jgi:hypothetical protein